MTPRSTPDMSGADWREEKLTVLNLRIVLRTNEPGLAEHLRSVFPPVEDDLASPVPPGRQEYTVSSLRGRAQQQAYQMKEAGRVLLETTDRDALLTYLERSVCSATEEHLGSHFLLIHAAALAHKGLGIILPGPSGAGKSLTAAALTASGFQYFSDEVAVVTDDGRLLPFPKVISLKADGWRKLTEAFPLVAPGCGPSSSESGLYHLNPSNPLRTGGRGGGPPVRFIILPSHDAAVSSLEPLPKAAALTRLVEQSMNLRQLGTRAMDLLVRLVQEAECYSLNAGSLQELGTLLAGLTRSGRRPRKP